MRYKNEPWGNQNLYHAFGPHYHKLLRDNYIYNVGVIAGHTEIVTDIIGLIFQLSLGRPIPIVDQAVYNYILSIPTFRDRVLFSNHEDGWAANLGRTTEAVKAGAGDLGAMCKDNATEFAKYSMNFEDVQPVIHNDGTVTTPAGIPYVAIHHACGPGAPAAMASSNLGAVQARAEMQRPAGSGPSGTAVGPTVRLQEVC